MKADGIDVIGFGAGEPDFDTPENIKEAGIAAIRANKTRYTPSAGILELREAACVPPERGLRTGVSAQPDRGGQRRQAQHLYSPVLPGQSGDEVILPAPYWVSYEELIRWRRRPGHRDGHGGKRL